MGQAIDIKVVGDAAWPELNPETSNRDLIELPTDTIRVAFLDNGTEGGQPVVLFRVDNGDKSYVMQITGNNFRGLAAAFRGKYGE